MEVLGTESVKQEPLWKASRPPAHTAYLGLLHLPVQISHVPSPQGDRLMLSVSERPCRTRWLPDEDPWPSANVPHTCPLALEAWVTSLSVELA